jgi:hypothetical protein
MTVSWTRAYSNRRAQLQYWCRHHPPIPTTPVPSHGRISTVRPLEPPVLPGYSTIVHSFRGVNTYLYYKRMD